MEENCVFIASVELSLTVIDPAFHWTWGTSKKTLVNDGDKEQHSENTETIWAAGPVYRFLLSGIG